MEAGFFRHLWSLHPWAFSPYGSVARWCGTMIAQTQRLAFPASHARSDRGTHLGDFSLCSQRKSGVTMVPIIRVGSLTLREY